MTMPTTGIGARERRLEDPRLLTGRTQFIDDIVVPGMLEAAVLRSPHPHARILRIDASAALALPGVRAVLTGADLQADGIAPQPVIWRMIADQRMTDHLALATDKVRYVGHPVAAVAAVDRYVAEDALALIDVTYDVLPAAPTLDEALAPDAPRLYEDWPDNVSARQTLPKGDIEAGFAQADVVVTDTLYWGRQFGAPLEPRGVVANWDPFTDCLDVWLSTQAPNLARDLLGDVLGVPVERIRVRTPDVGGGFGNKFDFYAEEVIAAVLSRRVGKPVKLVEDRYESFVATGHSREQRLDIEVGATADGKITALRGTVHGVLGGQLSTVGIGPVWAAAALMAGPYDIANCEVNVVGVVTNRPPYGSYRGWGQPKANFAHERAIELLAKRLNLPANEIRRHNFVAPDAFPYQGQLFVYDSGNYAECLRLAETAVKDAGWVKQQAEAALEGRSLGIGYSFHVEMTAAGPSKLLAFAGLQHSGFDESTVRIDPTGGVVVRTGLSAMGQGIQTALAQVAAAELGVPMSTVRVLHGDTETCPFTGYGTGGSRGAALGGGAVLRSAGRLREKVLRIAGALLEADPADLEIADGRITVKGTEASVTLRQVAETSYRRLLALPDGELPTLEEREVHDPPNVAFSSGATAVLVEVDRDTGRTTVLGYVIADDCGTVINPTIVDGQLHGAAAQAIGGALFEELGYDAAGQPQTATFMDYLMPTAGDVPPIETRHLETPSPHIPGGFKGVGEAGIIGGPSAIAAAIDNALADLDVHVTRLPVTPAALLDLMDSEVTR